MTPSLKGWSTKAKEAPSPHEVRLVLLHTSILMSQGKILMSWSVCVYIYIYIHTIGKQLLAFGPVLFCQSPQNKHCITCSSISHKTNVYNFTQLPFPNLSIQVKTIFQQFNIPFKVPVCIKGITYKLVP